MYYGFNSLISLAVFFLIQFELHFHLRAEIGGTRPAAEVLMGHLRREGCRHRFLPAQHADRHPLVLALVVLAGKTAS